MLGLADAQTDGPVAPLRGHIGKQTPKFFKRISLQFFKKRIHGYRQVLAQLRQIEIRDFGVRGLYLCASFIVIATWFAHRCSGLGGCRMI